MLRENLMHIKNLAGRRGYADGKPLERCGLIDKSQKNTYCQLIRMWFGLCNSSFKNYERGSLEWIRSNTYIGE
jgi:hypothetical protein